MMTRASNVSIGNLPGNLIPLLLFITLAIWYFFILPDYGSSNNAIRVYKFPKEDVVHLFAVPDKKVITLILGDNDKIHYYKGFEQPEIKTTDFGPKGLRKLIHEHLDRYPDICRDVGNTPGCWDPIFLIKPHKSARLQNIVNILDEMRLADAPKYVWVEISDTDRQLMEENGLE